MQIEPELLAEATEEELELYERTLEEELALQSPADYAEFVEKDKFTRFPHVELISETLRKLCDRELLKPDGKPYKRLMVFLPPQHGKSTTISKYGTSWYIAKHPDRHVIETSFEFEAATKWGRRSRDLSLSEQGKRLTHIRADVRATHKWETEEGGGMLCAGARGPVTGNPAHLFVIDDPFKDNNDANSELQRQRTDDWYQSVVLGRLQEEGVVVLIQTRWHDDDLAGRLLAREPEDWYVLNLPAIATGEGTDPLGRVPGDPLCPGLFSLEVLLEKKKGMSEYWWAAMFQQTPQVSGGGIFKSDSFRYFTESEEYYRLLQPNGSPILRKKRDEYRRFITVDTAVTAKTYSDYTVLLTCSLTPQKELLVLDCQRLKIESGRHQELLEAAKKRWKPDYFAVEQTAPSMSLIQMLKRKLIPVKALQTRGEDKVSRAMMAQEMLEQGRVYFPRNAPWLGIFEKELLIFDKGAHDDQVDAFSYACLEAAKWQNGPARPRKREPETIEELCWAQIKEMHEGQRYHDQLGDW